MHATQIYWDNGSTLAFILTTAGVNRYHTHSGGGGGGTMFLKVSYYPTGTPQNCCRIIPKFPNYTPRLKNYAHKMTTLLCVKSER